jgi:uncharacterized glyoxalase superfamily protein PhnB
MIHNQQTALVRQLWPLLAVQEIGRSVEFYCDQLGFAVVGRSESQGKLFWCRLERDGASLMLQQADDEDGPATGRGRGVTFYFICDDVDVVHAELLSRGLQLGSPNATDYGMKQLFVQEPDGYSICFESPTGNWNG